MCEVPYDALAQHRAGERLHAHSQGGSVRLRGVGRGGGVPLLVGRYAAPPSVFPWAAARSSDPSVLRRVALCPSNGAASTLLVVVYAFRALTPGTATLTAPIAQAWKRVKPARRRGLHSYRATVIVAS